MEESGEDVDQHDDGEAEHEEPILPVVGVHLDQDQGGREEQDDQGEGPDQPGSGSEPVAKESVEDEEGDVGHHGCYGKVGGELKLQGVLDPAEQAALVGERGGRCVVGDRPELVHPVTVHVDEEVPGEESAYGQVVHQAKHKVVWVLWSCSGHLENPLTTCIYLDCFFLASNHCGVSHSILFGQGIDRNWREYSATFSKLVSENL